MKYIPTVDETSVEIDEYIPCFVANDVRRDEITQAGGTLSADTRNSRSLLTLELSEGDVPSAVTRDELMQAQSTDQFGRKVCLFSEKEQVCGRTTQKDYLFKIEEEVLRGKADLAAFSQ